MTLRSAGGLVADPVDTGLWFKVSGCLVQGEDPVDVMITKITTSPTRQDDRIASRATWYDDTPDAIGTPGRPPATYRSITDNTHLGGTLNGCSLDIAVLLSSGATDPIVVQSVNVDYEVDGEAHSVQTSLRAVLCPDGTDATSHEADCTTR
ncbi:hypothetical protein [Nocardioides sp. URHA0020]|uniref:hypothetical protein n=1 Tax=Nocardioides sp. URHA0020 TaxID=1380392 RepID=UPI00048E789F|nr:hypothetical protein [Nocardioides sp. URHA0020]